MCLSLFPISILWGPVQAFTGLDSVTVKNIVPGCGKTTPTSPKICKFLAVKVFLVLCAFVDLTRECDIRVHCSKDNLSKACKYRKERRYNRTWILAPSRTFKLMLKCHEVSVFVTMKQLSAFFFFSALCKHSDVYVHLQVFTFTELSRENSISIIFYSLIKPDILSILPYFKYSELIFCIFVSFGSHFHS